MTKSQTPLSHDFRQFGVLIRNKEEIERLETFDDYVILYLKSAKKSSRMRFCGQTVAQATPTA